MFRHLLLCSAAALTLAVAIPAQNAPKASPAPKTAAKSAFDKPTLEAYARHLWVLGPEFQVKISDPLPSKDLPGFRDVTVTISREGASQDIGLYVSNDGSKILQATVYDVSSNPFKKDLDRLKTQFQPSQGTPGAPVVLVLFTDFQCPMCKAEAKTLSENLLKTYPKEVRLYFKDFPIESLHPWAKSAHIAGRCVFNQNPAAFWEYHDWIYGRQEAITPENLKEQVMGWSKAKDIDALQLSRCIDEKATAKDVDTNMAEARALGVTATPTLYVNGRRLVGTIEWNDLKRIIDYEIKYQATAKNAGEDCGCDTELKIPGLPANPTGSPLALPPAKKK
jgi:protein-disulfide isomerase